MSSKYVEDTTTELIEFALSLRSGDLEEELVHEVKRSLLNYLAAAVGASRHPVVEMAVNAAAEMEGYGSNVVLGRGEKVNPYWSALINGISSHVEDFDDTHLETLIHPGAPVYSALIAALGGQHVGGMEFLAAAAVGIEVALRVGRGLGHGHWDRGYHLTGTCGVIGASVSTSRILGLEPAKAAAGLGIASSQAAGVLGMLGTDTKALQAGKAAADGLLSSFLAKGGFTSSGLEVERGMAYAMSPNPNFGLMTERLGTIWHLSNISYKPFACGVVAHPAMDAVVRLRQVLTVPLDAVESIEAYVHPTVLLLMDNPLPTTSLESKFSIQHCIALCLVRGRAGVADFSTANVDDHLISGLRNRVATRSGDDLETTEAVVSVRLSDGREMVEHVKAPWGSTANPLTDEEIEEKFHSLTESVLTRRLRDAIIAAVWQLDDSRDTATDLIDRIVHRSATTT